MYGSLLFGAPSTWGSTATVLGVVRDFRGFRAFRALLYLISIRHGPVATEGRPVIVVAVDTLCFDFS